MSETFSTHPVRFLKNGGVNVGGLIYFGVVNGDPVNVMGDRIDIFSNRGLTIALPNPITTGLDGRTAVNGIPAKVWLGGRHSLFELDKFNVEQFQDLDKGETPGGGVPIDLTNVQGINTITAEATPAISAYVDKQIYVLNIATSNTGDVTLNIDSLGAKPIKFNFKEQISPNFFQTNQTIIIVYNSTEDDFTWVNSGRAVSLLTGVAGDGDTITANGGPSTNTYFDKHIYIFRANAANTGPVTLKIGTLATILVKKQNNETLVGGEIQIDQDVIVSFNATSGDFHIISQLSNQFFIQPKMCIPFFDVIANIPFGYVLCDGNNGTPNLVGRYLKGSNATGSNNGDTGGSTTTGATALSIAQMPAHTHSFAPTQQTTSLSGSGVAGILVNNANLRNTNSTGSGSSHTHPGNEPPFTNVLWIMKT